MTTQPWERPYKRGAPPAGLDQIHSYSRFRFVVLPAIRQVFKARCCYCTGSEDEKGGLEHFELEHFRPRKWFPNLEFKYANIYYSCRACNLKKGSIWPQPVTKKEAFLDPCKKASYPRYLKIYPDGLIRAVADPGPYMLAIFQFNERRGVQRFLKFRMLRTALHQALEGGDFQKVTHGLKLIEELENELLRFEPKH